MNENVGDITLLVVDDEPEIRNLIKDFLSDSEGYNVFTATDGIDALENVLPNNKIDLILSDINMPRMKGFDLLNRVKLEYPNIKRVLITAYNVEDYIELAIEHDVGNIFVKTAPFNFAELTAVLKSLINSDIFGPDRYMEGKYEEHEFEITRGDTLDTQAQKILSWLPNGVKDSKRLELVLVELLTNAIYYGIRGEQPDKKESWNYDFDLSKNEAILVRVVSDANKYAISILDNGGKLKKKDVLFWLHRQIGKDDAGLPLGVMDLHGRGFFIARRYIDRLIVNIETGAKTELIIINYYDDMYKGYKSLYINEI